MIPRPLGRGSSISFNFTGLSSIPPACELYHEPGCYESRNRISSGAFGKALGLRGVELSYEELFYVEGLKRKYVKLSAFDREALSIAKNRNILLLTGDRALKNAAEKEGVRVVGTIGLLDRLYREQLIDVDEYRYCLTALESSHERRMPVDELRKRLRNIP